jgi:hypothetical protein
MSEMEQVMYQEGPVEECHCFCHHGGCIHITNCCYQCPWCKRRFKSGCREHWMACIGKADNIKISEPKAREWQIVSSKM